LFLWKYLHVSSKNSCSPADFPLNPWRPRSSDRGCIFCGHKWYHSIMGWLTWLVFRAENNCMEPKKLTSGPPRNQRAEPGITGFPQKGVATGMHGRQMAVGQIRTIDAEINV
jgi:hypothetical protein